METFKDYGFYTNKFTKDKVWCVLSSKYPDASLVLLDILSDHYLKEQTLPTQDKLTTLLKEEKYLGIVYAETVESRFDDVSDDNLFLDIGIELEANGE